MARLFLPARTEELIRGEAIQALETLGEVVSVEERAEMLRVAAHGRRGVRYARTIRLLDRTVHALTLTVSPGRVGFTQAVINVVAGAGSSKEWARKCLPPPIQLDVSRGRTDLARGVVKWVPLSVRTVGIL